jgi:tetratricopeptide (TPR) repeat protein
MINDLIYDCSSYYESYSYSVGKMKKLTNILIVFVVLALTGAYLIGPYAYAGAKEDYMEGERRLLLGKYDEAINLFTKSLQQDPNNFRAYHFRGIALSKKGLYDKAIADLKMSAKLNPEYPDAYGLMAIVFDITGDYRSAVWAYKEAYKREKSAKTKKELEKAIKAMTQKMTKKKK